MYIPFNKNRSWRLGVGVKVKPISRRKWSKTRSLPRQTPPLSIAKTTPSTQLSLSRLLLHIKITLAEIWPLTLSRFIPIRRKSLSWSRDWELAKLTRKSKRKAPAPQPLQIIRIVRWPYPLKTVPISNTFKCRARLQIFRLSQGKSSFQMLSKFSRLTRKETLLNWTT
jgi:hypothetical protein